MLSNKGNTLNKLKLDFVGFSIPISRNCIAGEMQDHEDSVTSLLDNLFNSHRRR